MKKLSKIFITLIAVMALTACGNSEQSEQKATVTKRNGGGVEKVTAIDLSRIRGSNEAKFNEYYKGAKIEFTGTVKKVGKDSHWDGYEVIFEEKYMVRVEESENNINISNIQPGQKFHVISYIEDTGNCSEYYIICSYIKTMSDGSSYVEYSETTIEPA